MQLLFATGNSYKFSEIQSYLADRLPKLQLQQLELNVPETQEPNPENILKSKIEFIAQQADKPFIVDDVSFLTEKYKGFPGPYAKFINQTLGYDGWKKLFDEGDTISAVALIGLRENGETQVFKGEIKGILSFKRGSVDDPHAPLNDIIFVPELDCFLGEALKTSDFKNHRMRALDGLVSFMQSA